MRHLYEKIKRLPPDRQRWLIAGVFMLAQAFIWFVLFETLWYGDRSITDTPVYYDYASRMANGLMPYRDFASEYPPVAMLLFSLPRFLSGSSYNAFVAWFGAEMYLFSCGITALLTVAAWKQWRNLRNLVGALTAYTFFLLALGSIVELRFDLAAAFVILASIVCFITDRYLLAWLLVGIGLMTKVVPALLAPLYLIIHVRRRQFGEIWMGPAAAALAALIIAIPFLVSAPGGLANAFLYHAERPLQLESSWSTPLLLATKFAAYPVQILNSYGSHNVFSSMSDTFALLSGPVTVVLLIVGYVMFYKRGGDGEAWGSDQLVRFAAVAVGTFIFGGKVFSPQFLIWLVPLVPLVKGADRRLVLGMFTAVLLMTQLEFPYNYWRLYTMNEAVIIEVALRNALLGATLAFMAVSWVKQRKVEAGALLTASQASI